ncbi:calcium-binding protein [Sinorhizobium sp. RAC02]|uniref:calcium-binding protein n=1 Tax=Sinorhizobium sp. RAC02 TaxID=1842534 RepID=UPI00083E033E|nr:calcium-binding protein [Sinorhizobium sp. RAC02]AOF91626.1 hemolysin-type calcium-binding repeat family protein [Sinorhizobium sp. RAC02]
MAILKIQPLGNKGLDVNDIDIRLLGDYDFASTSATSARFFADDDNYALFQGRGFTYKKAGSTVLDITGGTVEKFYLSISGVKVFALTGLSLSASKLFDFFVAADPVGAFNYIFAGNDTIYATKFADILAAAGGDDTIYAGAGNDKVLGGSGNDLLQGEAGNDVLSGGSGNDKVFGGDGADSLTGESGNDMLEGGAGVDKLSGGAGADKLYGGDGNDILKGDADNDQLFGRLGNDVLEGGAGNDTLNGDSGNDSVNGGAGSDKLSGGAGADIFVFKSASDSTVAATGRDIILDFKQADGDRIDLKAIDANATLGGDQAFKFIGTAAFHKTAGELRYINSNGDTFVQGDINGDGKSDFMIAIDANLALKLADFIL